MRKSKKGLSEIVGYVILIIIAVTLAGLVYGWLKLQVPKDKLSCPDSVGIIIKDYACNTGSKTVNITIENRGYFNIDGINARASNQTGGVNSLPLQALSGAFATSTNGFIYFNTPLNPNLDYAGVYNYSANNIIKSIQITPFVLNKGNSATNQLVICSDKSTQLDINC